MKKKVLDKSEYAFSGCVFDGHTLDSAVTLLQEMIRQYGGDVRFEYDHGYKDVGFYNIVTERNETDEEYEQRLKFEQRLKQKKEDIDRKNLRDLLSKYPDEVGK